MMIWNKLTKPFLWKFSSVEDYSLFHSHSGDKNIFSPSDPAEIKSNNTTTDKNVGIQAKEYESTHININEGKPNNKKANPN